MVVVIHQMHVGALAMQRIKRVVPDAEECFGWQIVFRNLVQVFVVAVGHVNIVESAIRLVNTVDGLVFVVVVVGVFDEILRVDDFV